MRIFINYLTYWLGAKFQDKFSEERYHSELSEGAFASRLKMNAYDVGDTCVKGPRCLRPGRLWSRFRVPANIERWKHFENEKRTKINYLKPLLFSRGKVTGGKRERKPYLIYLLYLYFLLYSNRGALREMIVDGRI